LRAAAGETFFGIPVAPAAEANLLVTGVPWDLHSSYRRGAAKAPRAIREATTARLWNPFPENGIDLTMAWKLHDLGDAASEARGMEEVKASLSQTLRPVMREDALHLFLGGDHSITYASLSILKAGLGGRWGLLYLDAHPDLYPDYEGDPYSHACVVHALVREGYVEGGRVYEVGIRAPTPQQLRKGLEFGVTMVTDRALRTRGLRAVAEEAAGALEGVDHVYLSIDLDVLDPSVVPGVANPQPGGLSARELIDFVRALVPLPIGAFDVVEACPEYDPSGLTCYTAAKVIQEVLGVVGEGRGARPSAPP
jgi:agmatinase